MTDTKKPTVSIGMPVYNGAKYIKEALDSLLAQTYTDFELIISDNASTDSTQAICEEYASKDNRIRYIRQNENIGAVKNFQFVLDESVGEYFMWAAHDDLWGKSFIDNALNLLLEDSNIGFVFPSFQLVSINKNLFIPFESNIFNFLKNKDAHTRILGFANLHHESHKCNLVYSMFRKNIIKEALKIQNISNDGLLSMILLNNTRSILMDDICFFKRYENCIPGYTKNYKYYIKYIGYKVFKKKNKRFSKQVDDFYSKAKILFPFLKQELQIIKNNYNQINFDSNYKISNDIK
jgi:glycosyltransferase involved in cell wall biosynthesis